MQFFVANTLHTYNFSKNILLHKYVYIISTLQNNNSMSWEMHRALYSPFYILRTLSAYVVVNVTWLTWKNNKTDEVNRLEFSQEKKRVEKVWWVYHTTFASLYSLIPKQQGGQDYVCYAFHKLFYVKRLKWKVQSWILDQMFLRPRHFPQTEIVCYKYVSYFDDSFNFLDFIFLNTYAIFFPNSSAGLLIRHFIRFSTTFVQYNRASILNYFQKNRYFNKIR